MTAHSPDHAERAREVLGSQGDRHFAQNIVKHADDPRVSVLASHAIAAMLAYADERVAAALRGRDAVVEALEEIARISGERVVIERARAALKAGARP